MAKEPTVDQIRMDEAATVAEEELMELFNGEGARAHTPLASDVITWWQKHYKMTGHKRLGRILVRLNPNEKVVD